MKKIKALVLTFDKNRTLTDHMIFKYAQLWPDHPLQFLVPFQQLAPTQPAERVKYIQTPSAIKVTLMALLSGLDDEELVYWCIDDKYPVRLDIARIEKSYEWLCGTAANAIGGLLFCRSRRMWDKRCLTGATVTDDEGNAYLERSGYAQIWMHQFVRAKILRHVFESFPDEIPFPRYMDTLKNKAVKPVQHRLYVSRQNLAVFGESLEQGVLTRNCLLSLQESKLAVPAWSDEITRREFLVGTWKLNTKQRLRYWLGELTGHPPDFFY